MQLVSSILMKFFNLLINWIMFFTGSGAPEEYIPVSFDVLVRNDEPYGQFDCEAFYPYISEAVALPCPAGNSKIKIQSIKKYMLRNYA